MKTYVVALVVVVAVLGGFYGGYKVGQNNVSASTSTPGTRTNAGAGSNAFTGGRGGGVGAVCPSPGATPAATGTVSVARGTVANLGGTSMTVTNTSCDVKVTFGPTVTISKQALGSTSDLQDNQTVTISGTRQADGSILAQTIQIGPATGVGGIRPGAGGAASPPSGG
jgi:Domain of unknown function (DUF5666)